MNQRNARRATRGFPGRVSRLTEFSSQARLGAPELSLVVLLIAGAAGYLYLMRRVGISNDEWTWLLYRIHPTAAVLYPQPHPSFLFSATLPYNGQPIIGEVLLYRAWADAFGVGHYWVLRLAYLAAHICVVGLSYGLVRRRLGGLQALAVAALVLVSGRAWQTVLFPASLTFLLPTLAGLVAWRALDRPGGFLGASLAAILLALAAVSGGAALAVLAGLSVEIALRRQASRFWTVLPALALFVAWYVHGRAYVHPPPVANLLRIPVWGARFLASAAGATLGLGAIPGAIVLVGSAALIGFWRHRSGVSWPRSPRFAGLLTTLLVLAILTAFDRADTPTPPSSSRYMYLPAIVLLLIACEGLIGVRPVARRRVISVGLAAVLLAAVLGIPDLQDGRNFYLTSAQASAARMGAMRVAGLPPKEVEPTRLAYTPALLGAFVSSYGSAPIDSQQQLAGAAPAARQAVDQMLIPAEVRLSQGSLAACGRLPSGQLPPGPLTVSISARSGGLLLLSRYADPGHGQPIQVRRGGTVLHFRPDSLLARWRLVPAAGVSGLRICGVG